jgi:signal transduction histidine kinase
VISTAEGNGSIPPASIFLRLKPKAIADRKFSLLTQKIDELNREIFDRRRAEDESHRLYQEAAEASRLKDEFLATVSHELRTPLNAILGWTRMLRTSDFTPERLANALETIERSASSQNQLIDDLLDVSRIVTGKLRLDVRPVQISDTVAKAVESLSPAAENKSVRLQTILDPRAGIVSGDAERLQQAIWNLLANAIKFTPKGGRVQVRLERVNSHVEIIVSDTGIGIEPDFLPFVFDRFRQADGSKTRNYGGLGLRTRDRPAFGRTPRRNGRMLQVRAPVRDPLLRSNFHPSSLLKPSLIQARELKRRHPTVAEEVRAAGSPWRRFSSRRRKYLIGR